jgi:hypothetical protein
MRDVLLNGNRKEGASYLLLCLIVWNCDVFMVLI